MSTLRNDQIVLVALLLLDGGNSLVDTEDVAVRVDELAPGRFRWRKYRQHIDLGLVRNGLQDARKKSLAGGGALKGWTLTPLGLAEATELLPNVAGSEAQVRMSSEQRAWLARERSRLIGEPALQAASSEGVGAIPDREILRLFKLDEYASDAQRSDRIRRFSAAFKNDVELGPLIRQLAERLNNDKP